MYSMSLYDVCMGLIATMFQLNIMCVVNDLHPSEYLVALMISNYMCQISKFLTSNHMSQCVVLCDVLWHI